MKSIVFIALLLSGCAIGMHGAAPMHAPPEAPTPAAPTPAVDAASVEIIANYEHTKAGKLNVSLRAVTVGLEPPLRYHWILGNGKQWLGPEPWPQVYEAGRYDVMLTVTDAKGRVKRASMAIDAKSMGC